MIKRSGLQKNVNGGIPTISKEEGDVEKLVDTDGPDATNAGDGQWHKERSFHYHCQIIWCGLLDSPLLMEQGGVHMCHWPYYFSRISFLQKICGRRPIYPSEVIRKGIKNIPL